MVNTWIIGCGSIGKRVNQILQQQAVADIFAITRNEKSVSILKHLKINSFIADLDEKDSLIALPFEKSDIYYFAPPSIEGNVDTRMSNFLGVLKRNKPPRRIVYISTTGVYGDCSGNWITEQTPIAPRNARAKRRLNAEQQIQAYCKQNKTVYIILRVSGIYCEEKLPLDRIKKGLIILNREIAPASNRIHAADLTQICIAAMESTEKNCIFNVADGNPSSISDYFMQTAEHFNLPLPQEVSWAQAKEALSAEMLSYLTESKKIDPSLMIEKLKIQLRYPNLSAGLQACKNKQLS